MTCRPPPAAILALVLAAVLSGTGTTLAEEAPRPAPGKSAAAATKAAPGQKAAPDAAPDPAAAAASDPAPDPDGSSASPVRATAGSADLPVGVTLHGPRPPAAIAREQLKPGVTLLGPPPRVTWPRLIYRTTPAQPALDASLVPPFALPAASRPELRPPRHTTLPPPPRGRPGTQLAPLAAPPMAAWSAFPGGGDWAPRSAYAPADPEAPYPWNPVQWGGDWLADPWLPTSAWPAGSSAGDWSPVLWSAPPAWTPWQPSDSWNRSLELDDGTPEDEVPEGTPDDRAAPRQE
ncbi:MAG: hypothetical protein MUF27_09090 [Acidobacteria bacterium]|jgi:hypothetical protein|nr:hypothetical protein [Acidobacteriota bacterium]